MTKFLIRLLALLLMPVLILATPGTANAATVYSSPVTTSFTSGQGFTALDCEVIGYWTVPDGADPFVYVHGACSQGWGSEVNQTYIGSIAATGSGCSLTGGPVDDAEGSWTLSLTGGLGGVPAECSINGAEIHVCAPTFTSGVECSTQTIAWPIGPIPGEPVGNIDGCPDGSPAGTPTASFRPSPVNSGYYLLDYSMTFNITATGQAGVVVWYRDGNDNLGYTSVSAQGTALGQWTKSATVGPSWYGSGGTMRVVGIQGIIFSPSSSGTGKWVSGSNWRQNWDWSQVLQTGPPDTDMGGANWPERCSFYYGEQIAATDSDDHDLPAGLLAGQTPVEQDPPDVTATPPSEEAGCGFSVTNPATWLDAGMCGLVQAVMGLWGSVKSMLGILGGLVSSFGSLLQTLFIPSPSSWGIADLVDQFKTRPPGSLVTELGDGALAFGDAYSGAGGCGMIADFSSDDIDAPLTCSAVSSVPGYGALYGLAQAALLAFTSIGLFRMFASQLGTES